MSSLTGAVYGHVGEPAVIKKEKWELKLPNIFNYDKVRDSLKKMHEITLSTTPGQYELMESLKSQYIIDNYKEVSDFLLINRFLEKILLDAPSHIHDVFGSVPLHLEVIIDIEDGTEELFILIESSYPVSESIRLEKKLYRDWFFGEIKNARGKLSILEVPA
jgi:hypothetical protein